METLLLVEDEDAVRHLMTHSLRAYGFQVLEAANGEEALRVAAGHDGRIHLLMADVIMPGMSGKDVADRLAPLRPDMKVLFVSGYSEDVISHRGVLDPGVEYLHKPFTPQKLAAKVREVLGPLT
jgi:two-component system cell cycle sensor histidine kinase/response regulator CckA